MQKNTNHILSSPPKIHPIDSIEIPRVTSYETLAEVPVYELRKEGAEIILIEVVFYAGRPQEHRQMVATCCAPMMREGAGDYDAETLAEEVDYHGANLSVRASMDLISIKLVCLKKHVLPMLDLMAMVIKEPHFSKDELSLFVTKRVERLQVELAKNDVVSYRELTSKIYGDDHPYGYNSIPSAYQDITVVDLKKHHDRCIRANNAIIFAAGDITEADRYLFEKIASEIPHGGSRLADLQLREKSIEGGRLLLSGSPNQVSLKMGRRVVGRTHPDYDRLNFTSTLLGGFFGSRLVSRIREELGLTYGIYSAVDTQLLDGNFMIATEVANDKIEECMNEVYAEINRLHTELVEEEEIQLVKNYLMGHYLNLFDGPFNSLKGIKSIVLAGIPLYKLNSLISSSVSVTAVQVMETAQEYFNRNSFWEVIVGSHNMTENR